MRASALADDYYDRGDRDSARQYYGLALRNSPDARTRVSVIIPCYNAEAFLRKTLESVLGQTHSPHEVIVVDDGSTDASSSIAASMGPRVRVVRQAHLGPSAARNCGIDQTEGDLLAFLDADDCWHPHKLQRQVEFLASRPDCLLVHTGVRYIDSRERVLGRPADRRKRRMAGDCTLELLRRNSITTSSVLVRRDALAGDRFALELSGPEDWDLWLRLSARGRFGYLDEPLTDYRTHDGQLTRDTEGMQRASLVVMDRTLAREQKRALRAVARRHQRSILIWLGHLEYERGDFRRARGLFRRGAPALGPVEVIRYAASYFPPRVYTKARSLWRSVNGGGASLR